MNPRANARSNSVTSRIRLWYAVLLIIFASFGVRLFYLQIIQYNHYHQAAIDSQLKQYQIKAERGIIEAHDGAALVPIVLNENRYTLFADPKYIKDPKRSADAIRGVIGGDASQYAKLMQADSRYAVLAKKLTSDQKKALDNLKLKGVGTREESVRTYPQGQLAAQLLGFVDDEGVGKYGVEQALDAQLKGAPGELKAITDAQGVPLVANKNNVVVQPKPGQRLALTIDVAMQRQLEDILKAGLDKANSTSGSAVIMDPRNGAIKAMANYPTYNPAEFYNVKDANVFNNAAVSSPLEVGSVMKPLTMAAALDIGAVNKDATYYDPSHFSIDGHMVTNIEEDGGPGTRNLADILQLSLNTGATWLLMQMGGGQINEKARTAWHDYLTNHYHFGQKTGIEQGYEAEGYVPDPIKGDGLNIAYANTAFGQAMTATPLQMAAALASVVNGGTYYQPHLVDKVLDGQGHEVKSSPMGVQKAALQPQTSQTIRGLMEYVMSKNHVLYGLPNLRAEFSFGGKTGTPQIAKPGGGGYYPDRSNGVFIGFVGGNEPQYVIVVRVNEPHVHGYAGAAAAAPIYSNLANMLIDNFGVTPRT